VREIYRRGTARPDLRDVLAPEQGQNMQRQELESVVFNIAGGFVVLTVVGYMAASELKSRAAPQCTARFAPGQHFSLENSKGQLLSQIEMQGQSGSREWGVLKNTRVIKAAGAPQGKALEVKLSSTENEDRGDQNGLGFVWLVSALSKAQSACLSYSAFIPAGYTFPEAGFLPGLFGGDSTAALDQVPPVGGAVARMGWVSGGELGVEVRTPEFDGFWLGAANLYWPRGRWVAIEQEVKLNTPRQSDGVVRVWVDSELKIERKNLDLRGSDQFALSGVVADIGYARSASEPVVLQVSPFVVQWQ
jgi:hypothetical protein